jgi:ABC-2 type transport system ATP-binding protein
MDHGKVIARGTPGALVASIGADHLVELSTTGASDVDLAAVRRVAGVRDARAENGSIRIQATELHLSVPALLEELRRQGIPLTELSTHSATLEDVFVSPTGRHLRDE